MHFRTGVWAVFVALLFSISALAGQYPDPVGYSNSRANPYDPTGRVVVRNGGADYIGTGSAVNTGSVLSAGHMLYDPVGGWSTRVRFEYQRYGTVVSSTSRATTLYILSGYRNRANVYGPDSARTFARDFAGFVSAPIPNLTEKATWATNGVELLASNLQKMSLGYGAETHDGLTLLWSASVSPFSSLVGAYVFNPDYAIEGGMSGGPAYVSTSNGWYLAGINVSGGVDGTGVGVRGINDAAASFITTYLSK